jgi:hypothetical protein
MDFQSFVDVVCYPVALLYCGMSLSETEMVVWDPVLRIRLFIDSFEY